MRPLCPVGSEHLLQRWSPQGALPRTAIHLLVTHTAVVEPDIYPNAVACLLALVYSRQWCREAHAMP